MPRPSFARFFQSRGTFWCSLSSYSRVRWPSRKAPLQELVVDMANFFSILINTFVHVFYWLIPLLKGCMRFLHIFYLGFHFSFMSINMVGWKDLHFFNPFFIGNLFSHNDCVFLNLQGFTSCYDPFSLPFHTRWNRAMDIFWLI